MENRMSIEGSRKITDLYGNVTVNARVRLENEVRNLSVLKN